MRFRNRENERDRNSDKGRECCLECEKGGWRVIMTSKRTEGTHTVESERGRIIKMKRERHQEKETESVRERNKE